MFKLPDKLQEQATTDETDNKKSIKSNVKSCSCLERQKKCKIKIDYSRNGLLSAEAINTIRKSYLYEGNIQDLFANIAHTYSYDCEHAQNMYEYISLLIFIPSTPIIRSINKIDPHPISCFSNTLYGYSIYTCLDKFKEICTQLYNGGGCSVDLSNIAYAADSPEQAHAGNIENYIHAIEALHEFTRKHIPRKSAIAYYLDAKHPEIERFIEIRKPTLDPRKINIAAKTNIAVKLNKDFMERVKNNQSWNLINPENNKVVKTINARDLWVQIIKCRYETGEPFIYFEDNVEQYKPEVYKILDVKIGSSNLCTEIFIPCALDHKGQYRNGICCLGSINIAAFWTPSLTLEQRYKIVKQCLLFLDNILEIYSNELDPINNRESYTSLVSSRAIGLGAMGWHTYLINNMIAFESDEAEQHNQEIFGFLKKAVDQASIELGDELGHCQDNKDANLKGRFTLKIAIAPNAHISHLAGVSPGINPIISNYYQIKTSGINAIYVNKKLIEVINKNYASQKNQILQHMFKNGGSIQNISYISQNIKEVFKTAYEISQEKHIQICASRNKIIAGEQGQSINLYIHSNMSFGEILKVHMSAYKLGIKTLYYLHSSPVIQANNEGEICLSCI